MKHHLEMVLVQLMNHRLGIWEDIFVEREGPVAGIPSSGAKAGSQVNEDVAGQLLLTKSFCFLQDLLAARQGTMRLLVSERPGGRHVGKTNQLGKLSHQLRRGVRSQQENVIAARALVGLKDARLDAKVERPLRLVDEQSPAVGAHQPWDGEMRSVDLEVVADLAIFHGIDGTAAIKRVCAFAEPIDWSFATEKLQLRRILIEAEFLKEAAALGANGDAERVGLRVEHPRPPMRGLRGASGQDFDSWGRPRPSNQAAIPIELIHWLAGCSDGYAQDMVAYGIHRQGEHGWPRYRGWERFGGGEVQLEEQAGGARSDTLQEASSGESARHVSPPVMPGKVYAGTESVSRSTAHGFYGNVYLTTQNG
jgi:hypothetical protein